MLANRTKEVEKFKQIIKDNNSKKILLIEGKSGVGKTKLLSKCISEVPQDTSCIPIDLKSASSLGIPSVLSLITRRLGQQYFSNFQAKIRDFLSGNNVEVSHNNMIGTEQEINIILNTDLYNREIRLLSLINAFFEDLCNFQNPLIIIFDSYEKAPTELRELLAGIFLDEAVNTPNLTVVLAGQTVPKPTIQWINCYEHCNLENIDDAEAWWQFLQEENFTFPENFPFTRDSIKLIVTLCRGKPSQLEIAFNIIAKEW